jgi:hypothetical protein
MLEENCTFCGYRISSMIRCANWQYKRTPQECWYRRSLTSKNRIESHPINCPSYVASSKDPDPEITMQEMINDFLTQGYIEKLQVVRIHKEGADVADMEKMMDDSERHDDVVILKDILH